MTEKQTLPANVLEISDIIPDWWVEAYRQLKEQVRLADWDKGQPVEVKKFVLDAEILNPVLGTTLHLKIETLGFLKEWEHLR